MSDIRDAAPCAARAGHWKVLVDSQQPRGVTLVSNSGRKCPTVIELTMKAETLDPECGMLYNSALRCRTMREIDLEVVQKTGGSWIAADRQPKENSKHVYLH